MGLYLLTPPFVWEGPAAWNRLHVRVSLKRGVTLILRWDNSIYEARYPAQTELEEAKDFWMGGSEYIVSQETADLLIAAGYGDNLTPYFAPGTYGAGNYGSGSYGGE